MISCMLYARMKRIPPYATRYVKYQNYTTNINKHCNCDSMCNNVCITHNNISRNTHNANIYNTY